MDVVLTLYTSLFVGPLLVYGYISVYKSLMQAFAEMSGFFGPASVREKKRTKTLIAYILQYIIFFYIFILIDMGLRNFYKDDPFWIQRSLQLIGIVPVVLLLFGIINLQEKSEAFAAKSQNYYDAKRYMADGIDDYSHYDISS